MDTLITQQQALHDEADIVLKDSGLIQVLSPYGTVDVSGSYKTELMVWRDIDIGVTPKLSKDDLWKVAQKILGLESINQITIQDNAKKENPNAPDGYYLGVKYRHGGNVWKIDIWFADSLPQTEYDNSVKNRLDEEKRGRILEIKNQVFENPKYRKTFFSVDIYNAVLDAGITNLEEFKDYLVKQNKNL